MNVIALSLSPQHVEDEQSTITHNSCHTTVPDHNVTNKMDLGLQNTIHSLKMRAYINKNVRKLKSFRFTRDAVIW